MINPLDKFKHLADGAATLRDWLGQGGIPVSQQLAQIRTNICLKCPLNRDGGLLAESVAKAIKQQVEVRNALGLRTNGIKSLKSCAACDCYLPLKIWVPLALILPEPGTESKYWEQCWLRHEQL